MISDSCPSNGALSVLPFTTKKSSIPVCAFVYYALVSFHATTILRFFSRCLCSLWFASPSWPPPPDVWHAADQEQVAMLVDVALRNTTMISKLLSHSANKADCSVLLLPVCRPNLKVNLSPAIFSFRYWHGSPKCFMLSKI